MIGIAATARLRVQLHGRLDLQTPKAQFPDHDLCPWDPAGKPSAPTLTHTTSAATYGWIRPLGGSARHRGLRKSALEYLSMLYRNSPYLSLEGLTGDFKGDLHRRTHTQLSFSKVEYVSRMFKNHQMRDLPMLTAYWTSLGNLKPLWWLELG